MLLNSFRSHYELSAEPRGIERRWTVIHMGVSAYLEEGVAQGTAQRFPKLGDFVAQLVLEPGNGINYAHTGHPLHLTLWADPIKLNDAVTDIGPAWEWGMAYYVILDSTANLVDSFDREDEARAALEAIVRQDPDAADDYAMLTYDDAGHPIGEALTGADLGVRV